MKKKRTYITPDDFTCPECGEPCMIKPLDNSFSYSGTHCTHGRSGVHYPSDYGMAVTDCCEYQIEDVEEEGEWW